MFRHSHLMVFDIETVPDLAAAKRLTGAQSNDPTALRAALSRYHLDVTEGRNAFPRQPFHQVVCVSFVEAEIRHHPDGSEEYTLTDVRSGGFEHSLEKEIIQGFFQYMNRQKPRLVSFNGRTFDLPVLKYRALKHGVPASWLWRGGDKWANYHSRYAADWHCDLIDVLSDNGASARIRLEEACSILGLPGKFGVDGSAVTGMFEAGELGAIRRYCETDALNTYLVYLHTQHHRGITPTSSFNKSIAEVVSFLSESDQAEKPHFHEFLEAWTAACEGAYFSI
jgi:3'-5' exonuclease